MYQKGNESVTETTAYEVDKALDELNTYGKSIDPDEIHPTILKNMGQNMKELLRTFFNRVLEDKKWPFVNNEVIFFPKSGKDSYLTSSSFRLITKSSYIGKLMERTLKNRILNYLRENNLEDSSQEGFMKNRSTGRYITDLVANIEDCWANKSVPVALMVDLEKAFDSVRIHGLLLKMHYLGINGNIWSLIKNFLEERKSTFELKASEVMSSN